MRLGPEWPLKFASFQVKGVPCVGELAELSAGENEFDDEMQEEIVLGFVFHLSRGRYSIIEKVCDLAGEYFRTVILFYKSILLGFNEQSRQVFARELYIVVGDNCFADDEGAECDVV